MRFVQISATLACAVSLFSAQLAAKDTPEVALEPGGPWQLEMAENNCRIARLFGPADNQHVFYLEQWQPSAFAKWQVAGPRFAKYRASRNVEFIFGPDGQADSFSFIPSTLGKFGSAVGHSASISKAPRDPDASEDRDYDTDPFGLPSLDAESAQNITRLSVFQRKNKATVFELGDMRAPLAALNTCMNDLVESWGYDLQVLKQVKTPPKLGRINKVAGAIMQTYPRKAWMSGAQADFLVRLDIDENGQIKGCVSLNQTAAETFDVNSLLCDAYRKHARIEPARLTDGTAVRSYHIGRIIYRM